MWDFYQIIVLTKSKTLWHMMTMEKMCLIALKSQCKISKIGFIMQNIISCFFVFWGEDEKFSSVGENLSHSFSVMTAPSKGLKWTRTEMENHVWLSNRTMCWMIIYMLFNGKCWEIHAELLMQIIWSIILNYILHINNSICWIIMKEVSRTMKETILWNILKLLVLSFQQVSDISGRNDHSQEEHLP